MPEHYDFCGYATKNDLLCSDGRTIRRDAFKGCDGMTVPLVWNHRHDDPEMVIGHALLENRKDGVFMWGKLNDTEKGKACKKILENKDLRGLSIYANNLKQRAGDVLHGVIREVSLVLSGANPGALIDFSLAHGDDSDGEVYAYLIGDEYTEMKHGDLVYEKETIMDKETLVHAEEEPKEKEEKKDTEEKKAEPSGKDPKAVFNTLTEEQKELVYAMLIAASEDAGDDDDDEDEEEKEDMKHNVFENEERNDVLSHADMDLIFRDAKRLGSLRDAVEEHMENGVLQHATTPDEWGVSRGNGNQTYFVRDPEMLFPDYKAVNNVPSWIKRDTGWVAEVMSGVKHVPWTRIKSMHADITGDDARALGYIKGNMKKEEFFTLIKRTTDPQTIYKKQKMDRDDMLDITDFDVVSWIKGEMRLMLEEEIARAILIGDGRSTASNDKIQESHVRPIASDSSLYSVPVQVAAGADFAKRFIKAAIAARKNYKGSGVPTLFTTEDMLTDMLLIEDLNQRFIYTSVDQLATTLRVRKIVTVPVMENNSTFAIITNLNDYCVGADKGGNVSMFDDFDIDYNQQKYLIETRISGALVQPYSALVFSQTTEP